MCYFIKTGINPPLFQRPPNLTLLPPSYAAVRGIVIHGPASSSPLDHFYFFCVYFWVKGLHVVEAYSSCGRTIVLYAASRTPLCFVLTLRLMKPSDLFALGVILFM